MRVIVIMLMCMVYGWAGMIQGVVVDAKTNQPLKRAIIVVGTQEYHTNELGEFVIPQTRLFGVRAMGYERKWYRSGGKIALHPFAPKALYLSGFGATDRAIMHQTKKLIDTTKINALVIDMKMDRGQITYASINPYAKKIGAQKMILIEDLPRFVRSLKQLGIYTIARIVTFKDSSYVQAYPAMGIHRRDGSLFKDNEGLYWIDPSRKEAWNYPIQIAQEVAAAGFDEIQFDYIRFPEASNIVLSVPNVQSERVKAIAGFLRAARKALIAYNVFISIDVFGYTAWNTNDTHIGQKLPIIARDVDYISPMLYPSGFHKGIPRYRNPVAHNYEIIHHSLIRAAQQSNTPMSGYRPWLQAFRDYAFDHRRYGDVEIREQIRASEELHTTGWMLWNPTNRYTHAGL